MATIAHEPLTICQPRRRPARPPLLTRLRRLFAAWKERRRGWRAYAHMSERDLRDAGLVRWQIERELARPFWRG